MGTPAVTPKSALSLKKPNLGRVNSKTSVGGRSEGYKSECSTPRTDGEDVATPSENGSRFSRKLSRTHSWGTTNNTTSTTHCKIRRSASHQHVDYDGQESTYERWALQHWLHRRIPTIPKQPLIRRSQSQASLASSETSRSGYTV